MHRGLLFLPSLNWLKPIIFIALTLPKVNRFQKGSLQRKWLVSPNPVPARFSRIARFFYSTLGPDLETNPKNCDWLNKTFLVRKYICSNYII